MRPYIISTCSEHEPTEEGLPDAPRTGDEIETYAKNAAKSAQFIRERYGDLYKTIAYKFDSFVGVRMILNSWSQGFSR